MTPSDFYEIVGPIGEVMSKGSMTEDDPVIVKRELIEMRRYRPVAVHFWKTVRRDGSEVLIIEMKLISGPVASLDLDAFRQWVLEFNSCMLLSTLSIERHIDGDLDKYDVKARHALPADCVTTGSIESVLETMRIARSRCRRRQQDLVTERHRFIVAARRAKAEATALRDLEALVGLDSVKAMVKRLSAQRRVSRFRERAGLRTVTTSPHLVFTGNPGTGKTTVARLIGRLYREMGLLSSGHLVEVDRSGLVAGYIGQTALRTMEACDKAAGGVLFIDEAYSLRGHDRDFGREAVETLLTCMESRRGDLVVVVAGYPDEMNDFIGSNPGLRSRFDLTLHFPDYVASELRSIFDGLVAQHDYVLEPEADVLVDRYIGALPRPKGFGNGREIRRMFNDVVCNHAALLLDNLRPSGSELRTITAGAIPRAVGPDSALPGNADVVVPQWHGYL